MVVVLYSNKKGQLEIGITMMVLLVFIILLVISLAFYFRFTQENIKETKQEILDEKFSGLLDVIINLPELRYSLNGAEKNCLDSVKLENFNEVVTNSLGRSEYYNNLLEGVNTIWVNRFYYNSNTNKIEESSVNELYDVKGEGLIYSSPVSVYNVKENRFEIGILRIQTK